MAEPLALNQLPTLPLTIQSAAGPIELQTSLRFLPGKRLVGKASFQGRPALLKLITDSRQGRRLLLKEQTGHQLAAGAGLTLPAIEFVSEAADGSLLIAYEWLPEARAFAESDLQDAGHCQQLIELMAKLHQAGLIHDDLHVDNLLFSAGALYLVDYAAIKRLSDKTLAVTPSLNNLALLMVQFTDAGQQRLKQYFADYCALRQWPLTDELTADFDKAVAKAWQKRQRAYLKKCFRDCTMTAYQHNFQRESAFRREFLVTMGNDFIGQLDQLIADGELLKDGNSATVAKVALAGQTVVIKRFNIKSFGHFLKRCWRLSRAANAWHYGRLLELIGLPTPKVLGFVEKRFGPLRREAYLISEWAEAQELASYFQDAPPEGKMTRQIDEIFALLKRYRLHHGDLKASNLLIDVSGQIQLIDLDAMRQINNKKRFLVCYRQDLERFQRNWQNQSGIEKK
ncbi:MAG: lipopolysaccharide kinase InaA family protein [Methylophaga sp.]